MKQSHERGWGKSSDLLILKSVESNFKTKIERNFTWQFTLIGKVPPPRGYKL
jgi:hypothetical protein